MARKLSNAQVLKVLYVRVSVVEFCGSYRTTEGTENTENTENTQRIPIGHRISEALLDDYI